MSNRQVFQDRLEDLEERVVKLQGELGFWKKAGIPEKTIVVLLSHYTKVPQGVIKQVLAGIDNLYSEYFEEDEDE